MHYVSLRSTTTATCEADAGDSFSCKPGLGNDKQNGKTRNNRSEDDLSVEDVSHYARRRCALTDTDKLYAIDKSRSIYTDYSFPMNEDRRRYNCDWESKYQWLVYSPEEDGAYCCYCVCFASTKSNGELIEKPFHDWKNALGEQRGRLNTHNGSDCHATSIARADEFISVVTQVRPSVSKLLSSAYEEKVRRNTAIMIAITEVLLMLGQRGLPLRGNWNAASKSEDGNFNYFVHWKATMDEVLKNHLDTAPKNARYLSPHIQNELLACIKSAVRERIVQKAAQSRFFSIMADETTDSATKEQLSVCIRYLERTDHGCDVKEDFVCFAELEQADAKTIADTLTDELKCLSGLNMQKLRGQGFDGASVMSGNITGVQARIKQLYPKAKYFTHCANHRINLVVVASCKSVPEIRNFMDCLQQITLFVSKSAKRKAILLKHMKSDRAVDDLTDGLSSTNEECEDLKQIVDCGRKQSLPTLCDTRWLARVDSISTLLSHLEDVFDAVEEIKSASTAQSASDASSYLQTLSQFSFIYSAVITQYCLLAYLRPLTVALQATDTNLVECHEAVQSIIEILLKKRHDDDTCSMLYNRAVHFASRIEVEPSKPRTTGRQTNRANAGLNDVETYYKVSFITYLFHHSTI